MFTFKNKFFTKLIFIFLVSFGSIKSEKADIIIFSFDRPIQLYALLESIKKYTQEIDKLFIIYRTSSEQYNKCYNQCFQSFKDLNIMLFKQGDNPKKDFKTFVMHCLDLSNQFILFAVDDIIIKDHLNLPVAIKYLISTNANGFYFRLGKNITECFTENIKTPPPILSEIYKDIYIFSFNKNKGDWGYPSTVDMTLYKKDKIKSLIEKLDFNSPNTFESAWAAISNKNFFGLCFGESKIVNIPLNLVQNDYILNKNMNYSVQNLLEKFESGFKIDINQFYKINNTAPHMSLNPTFIPRN